MKIKNIDSNISVSKFKNKEDFCNRLIQEISLICKKNFVSKNSNKKLLEIEEYKKQLIEKNIKLDQLIEKSLMIQKELQEKIKNTIEENNNYKLKLLELLETIK